MLAVAAALLYFIRLGATDLGFWDEILYATRALSIGHESGWLNQMPGSVGGLWTAAHPPLVIWQMALLARVFGASEWALRAPAALAGVGCVLVFYLLIRRLAGPPAMARIAAVALLLIGYFTTYARRAQLDVPTLFWILVCLYCGWRGIAGRFWWFAASGIALGLGLMSKILVGLLAPLVLGTFLITAAFSGSRPHTVRGFLGLGIIVLVGVAVAAPWPVYITAKLGPSYWSKALGYHVLARATTPLEGHASSLGVVYWPHQILLRLGPLLPLLLIGLSPRASAPVLRADSRRFLLAWLLVPLLGFTVVATKFHPYLLLFLFPLVAFAAAGIYAATHGALRPTVAAAIAPASLGCLVWSLSSALQRHLESLAASVGGGRPPAGSDLGPLVLFLLATSTAMIACGLVAGLLVKAGHRSWLTHAPVAVAVTPAIVLALAPLVIGRGSWRELRSELHRLAPERVTLVCDDPVVGRYQLRAAANGSIHPAWTVASVDSVALPSEALRDPSGDGSDCVVIERAADGAATPVPSGFRERWRNRRFVLFSRA